MLGSGSVALLCLQKSIQSMKLFKMCLGVAGVAVQRRIPASLLGIRIIKWRMLTSYNCETYE